MPAITLQNFSYAYHHPAKVLDTINFSVESGSFTAILGPSGAGKTTVCLAIAGAVPHYFGGSLSGSVTVHGTDTRHATMPGLAQTVGTVLQDYETQLVTLTVEEEVAFGLYNLGRRPDEVALAAKDALAKVGLNGFEQAETASLSGGQKQRLVLASVLAAKPKILVLDEPASALDPEATHSLYQLLNELNKNHGITIVVVEHEISQILPYANQFILLDHGRLMEAGSPEKVLTAMYDRQIFTEAIPPLWQLKFQLEKATGYRFAAWQTEQAAIDEIRSVWEKGASKSA